MIMQCVWVVLICLVARRSFGCLTNLYFNFLPTYILQDLQPPANLQLIFYLFLQFYTIYIVMNVVNS
jgi:hypothetical protein